MSDSDQGKSPKAQDTKISSSATSAVTAKEIKGAEDDVQRARSENLGAVGPQTTQTDSLEDLMKAKLRLEDDEEEEKPKQVLPELNLAGIAEYIRSGQCKKIITMAGAGISTSAGIPDFRSPGSGLYDNLQKYNLPTPEAMFEINFFKENPEPFFDLARELWPGQFKPTPCHYFLRMLQEKNLLLRHYTQNIDTLELIAGLSEEKVVEAHGSFARAHCLTCRVEYSKSWMQEKITEDDGGVPKCTEKDCEGIVKPDIVFFGESLPARFFQCVQEDFDQCDLLIVMGTSLVVQPFASLTSRVNNECPRAYFNMEEPPTSNGFMRLLGMGHDFAFDSEENYRDVFCQGSCDDTCYNLAKSLGWEKDLKRLVKNEHARIDEDHLKEAAAYGQKNKAKPSL